MAASSSKSVLSLTVNVKGIEKLTDESFQETTKEQALSRMLFNRSMFGHGLDVNGTLFTPSYRSSENKLIAMLHEAFMKHLAVELRPDDLWLVIVQQLAIFVRSNREALKDKLVKGEGAIVVRDDTLSIENDSNDWTSVLNQFEQGCRKLMVDERLADTVMCNFDTSTPVTRVASQVGLFDILSCYISFSTMTMSGIPEVHLVGNMSDWEKLISKCQTLIDLGIGLEKWLESLKGVLHEIVQTATLLERGENLDDHETLQSFWRSIYHYENESGGPRASGWITAFFAYIQTSSGFQSRTDYDWQPRPFRGIKPGEFPVSHTSAPMSWNYLGKDIRCSMVGGLLAMQRSSSGVVSVVPGWAIVGWPGQNPLKKSEVDDCEVKEDLEATIRRVKEQVEEIQNMFREFETR